MQEADGVVVNVAKPQLPAADGEEREAVRCPRCDSANTKFCYYNNYNLSQPRHFCKDCRRYWTKGGSLRNVPVGGGTRKNSKRAAAAAAAAGNNPKRVAKEEPPNPLLTFKPEPISFFYPGVDSEDRILDIGESFSSLLASGGSFGSLLDSFQSSGQGGVFEGVPAGAGAALAAELQSSNDSSGGSENQATPQMENLMGVQGHSTWPGGWPDLAIYTPGSGFQ